MHWSFASHPCNYINLLESELRFSSVLFVWRHIFVLVVRLAFKLRSSKQHQQVPEGDLRAFTCSQSDWRFICGKRCHEIVNCSRGSASGTPSTPQLVTTCNHYKYMTFGIKVYQSMVEECWLFASCGMTSLCIQAAVVQGVHKDVQGILRPLHHLRRKQRLAAK